MTTQPCPACGHVRSNALFNLESVPQHSCILLRDPATARDFPRGRLALRNCSRCGFIFNAAFDPGTQHFAADYEESQAYSEHFNRFERALADQLVSEWGMRGKLVLDIGCGKGSFLQALCSAGNNRGIGVDPSYVPGRFGSEAIRFHQTLFTRDLIDEAPDLICCRHTLEHIPDVAGFLCEVRAVSGSDTLVFFEVPDVTRMLTEPAFWDIYYEHCGYFSPGSLNTAFAAAGFDALKHWRDYGNQYLMIMARASKKLAPSPARPVDIAELTRGFSGRVDESIKRWRNRLTAAGRVVLWGSGSKAVAFITATDGDDLQIHAVIDINPHKQGTFLPGSGLPILAPAVLPDINPDTVVAMNPVYRKEISMMMADAGVSAELLAAGDPV